MISLLDNTLKDSFLSTLIIIKRYLSKNVEKKYFQCIPFSKNKECLKLNSIHKNNKKRTHNQNKKSLQMKWCANKPF
jgi:hypothetical protein